MSAEYVNRRDDRYYLFEGRTKTGKPKYFCSKKSSSPSGRPIDEMPEGYEWRENPETATVSVRKSHPTQIIDSERQMLDEAIRNRAGFEAFVIDLTQDSLVVYLPDRDPDDILHAFARLGGLGMRQAASLKSHLMKSSTYCAMMRFTLIDPDMRLFAAERWCFRGSIDHWIYLKGNSPLPQLIDEYVDHLGQDSFFELM